MQESFDIVIVGGGISGVSLAARLAPHAKVCVLEAEMHLAMHATGRSAALFVESYGPPAMRRLTSMSRDFFVTPPEDFSDAPLTRPRSGLVFGEERHRAQLKADFALAEQTAEVIWLEADGIAKHAPLLKPGAATCGFLEPGARDIDTDALLQGFLRAARRHGTKVVTSAPLARAERQGGGWRLDAGDGALACRHLVNASGAWADRVAAIAGVAPKGLQPKRRTAATIGVPDELAALLARHPFATPVDESFYFKPETGAIMVSLSEETPSEPCDAYPEDIDVATALERFHEATIVPRARPLAAWAGLRTFAPDRLPVAGPDPEAPDFFWYVGQGGYGIQTSPAHSALAAKALLGEALSPAEAEILHAFRPHRFAQETRR
jgi:D-arginine dehydrogenase